MSPSCSSYVMFKTRLTVISEHRLKILALRAQICLLNINIESRLPFQSAFSVSTKDSYPVSTNDIAPTFGI